jgi:integrase
MGIQTRTTKNGEKRYKARIKVHGREVATRIFKRKRDAEHWEDDQYRKLRVGEWFDPRRGKVPLSEVAVDWLESRGLMKRKTRAADNTAWKQHIEPRFGRLPVASITTADVSAWVGRMVADGRAPSTASRYLASLRSLLEFARQDGRTAANAAATAKVPRSGRVRREPQFLSRDQIAELMDAATGRYVDVIKVLALTGMRWGELAGLRVGDRIRVPGQGLRLQRAVLASSDTGELYEDTLKNHAARTVPLVAELVPILDSWSAGKSDDQWVFPAPEGGPLSESNWKRAVQWPKAKTAIGKRTFRVHDLRHTCASLWLAGGADPKVLQRILGHASAAMTMDLYGHLIDTNLWAAADRLRDPSVAMDPKIDDPTGDDDAEVGQTL